MPDNAQLVRERMISDLVASERQMRQAAEKVLAEFRELLYHLAGQLAGEQVQEIKRRDPSTFQSWISAQWRAFFDGVLKDRSLWTLASPDRHQEQFARLEAEKERLRQSASAWQGQKRTLESQLHVAQQRITTLEDQLVQTQRPPVGFPRQIGVISDSPRFARVDLQAGVHAEILKALRKWNVPTRPARFARLLSKEELQWRRQSMALIDNRVLVAESLHLLSPETSLALVRLNEEGRDLCRVLGWEPIESDWERLLRLRSSEKKSERSLAILILAMHARLRGWQVEAVPEVAETGLHADVLLRREAESLVALVALGDEVAIDQWQELAAHQGQVALLSKTILQRQRLASEIRYQGLNGLATSLEELIKTPLQDILPGDELWKDRWVSGQPPDEKGGSLSPLPAGS